MYTISWTTYWLCSGLTLLIYVGIIAFIYRKTFKKGNALPPRTSSKDKRLDLSPSPDQLETSNTGAPMLDAASAAPMHSLVDELQAYVIQAGEQGTEKEELLHSIGGIIQKYPSVIGSVFQDSITQMLLVIVEHNCGLQLSEDEMKRVWPG